jgi:beta-N-acetylhexosaminidase
MPLDEWRSEHAPPFAAGIEAGAELVMTGHLRFTAVDGAPASLSPEWYRILREELGFDGVAITDDLGMLLASGDARYADPVRNAVDAVAAGADMTLMVAGSDRATAAEMAAGIASAAEGGDLDPRRLEEAATRVVTLRVLASGLLDGTAFD